MTRELASEVRDALCDPQALCDALGLEPSRTERKKWRCPRHGGTSLSVTRGARGGLRAKCFGCEFTGDAFGLIAEVYGLDVAREFPAVVQRAAELVGYVGAASFAPDPRERARTSRESRAYPARGDVSSLLEQCIDVSDDAETAALVSSRGLEPWRVDDLQLARALPRNAVLPAWARLHGHQWTETGHRLILPVVDALGDIRSVRAWRVTESDTPKRLPPAGYRAAGLVLACPFARGILAGARAPDAPLPTIVICEGEPDFLTWATMFSDANENAPVVLGVVAGAWDSAIAARIPTNARVLIRTHHDDAGERYAREIAESLPKRVILRSRPKLTRAA